jgi:hypothetical protein
MNLRPFRWLLVLAAMLPFLIPLVLIASFGRDYLFWDEWDPDIAGVYVKAHQHQLIFADLAAQHYEHRILVPRVIWLALLTITRGNVISIMLLGWGVSCITSGGLLGLIATTFTPGDLPCRQRLATPRVIGIWLLCNLLLFCPMQWQNWIWGIGTANLLPAMWVVVGIIVAQQARRMWIATTALISLCALATYSSGNGLVSWPIAGLMILFVPSAKTRRDKGLAVLALGIACILCVGLYLVGFQAPDHRAEEIPGAGGLLDRFQFFIAFIGNTFTGALPYTTTTAGTIGGIGVGILLLVEVIYVVVSKFRFGSHELMRRAIPWIAVASYSVLAAALGAVTRAKFGVGQAVTPRYISFGLFAPLALVPLTAIVADDVIARFAMQRSAIPSMDTIAIRLPAMLAAFVLLVPLLSWNEVLDGCRSFRTLTGRSKGTLLLAKVLPNNPQLAILVTPRPAGLVANAIALNEMGYIHPPLIQSADARQIEQPQYSRPIAVGRLERAWTEDNGQIFIRGWAICPDRSNQIADAVFLTYDNENGVPVIFATAREDVSRPDLAQQFGDADCAAAGWLAKFSDQLLPADLPNTRITAWSLDTQTGRAARLEGPFTIQR